MVNKHKKRKKKNFKSYRKKNMKLNALIEKKFKKFVNNKKKKEDRKRVVTLPRDSTYRQCVSSMVESVKKRNLVF